MISHRSEHAFSNKPRAVHFGFYHHEGVFKLGEGGNHGEEEFALGGRGVDVLLQHLKRDIVLVQLRRNL